MKELMDDFKNKVGIERLGVWFVYICAQFLVLASLLLTTTSVVAHGIFLILSIVFYFLTAVREVPLCPFSQEFTKENVSPINRMQS